MKTEKIIAIVWLLMMILNVQAQVVVDIQTTRLPECSNSTMDLFAKVSPVTGSYACVWSTGATGQSLSRVVPGTYWVQVTNLATGVIGRDTIAVTAPAALQFSALTVNSTHHDGEKNGGNTGNVSFVPVGGTQPYQYAHRRMLYIPMDTIRSQELFWTTDTFRLYWKGIDTTNRLYTTQNLTHLSSGRYDLKIIDANGCVTTQTVQVPNLHPLQANRSKDTTDCPQSNDGDNGVGHIQFQGSHPYAYVSSNNPVDTFWMYDASYNGAHVDTTQTGDIIADSDSTNLWSTYGRPTWYPLGGRRRGFSVNPQRIVSRGHYQGFGWERLISAEGWEHTFYMTNTYPRAFLTGEMKFQDIVCHGGTTTISVSSKNGYANHRAEWNWLDVKTGVRKTATGFTLNNMVSNVYTVSIHDENECIITMTDELREPEKITLKLIKRNDPSCTGKSDAKLEATYSGGNGTLTATWSTRFVGRILENIPSGSYKVEVMDQNKCTAEDTISVVDPRPLDIQVSDINNVSCNGYEDGHVRIDYTGGTGTAKGKLSRNGIDYADYGNKFVTKLSAGKYSISLQDENLCPAKDSFLIIEPSKIVVTSKVTNALCYDSTGSVQLTATGGTGTLQILWSDGNTEFTRFPKKGEWYWTVSDQNTCKKDSVVRITQPDVIQGSLIPGGQVIKCAGDSTVTITANVYGGTNIFTYAWLPTGKTTKNVSQVGAGTHYVRVKDSNGCPWIDSIYIPGKLPLQASLTVQKDVSCFGFSDGSATLALSGGTPGYAARLYDNKNAELQTVSSGRFNDLSAGTYLVKVNDVNLCETSFSMTILQPDSISASATIENVLCYNGNTGSIAVKTSGGSNKGFNITWRPSSLTGFHPTDLPLGDYTAVITDKSNTLCFIQKTWYVDAPKQMPDVKLDIENCSEVTNKDRTIVLTAQDGKVIIRDVWWMIVVPLSEETFTLVDKYGNRIARNNQALEYPIVFENLDTGVYTLYTKAINGCVWETHITILLSNVVKELPWYQSFSPNNQGPNEVWNIPRFWREVTQEVYIYESEKHVCVYHSTDLGYHDPWNGRMNNTGDECPEGWYKVVVVFNQDGKKTSKEDIILLKRTGGY